MGLTWKEEYLDFVLVPSGLLIMFGYHLYHLNRCIRQPHTTVIGYENHNRKAWVQKILQVEAKDRGQAISMLSSSISAATSLSSISLALSSLIGAWIGNSSQNDYITKSIYGNTSHTVVYIKFMCLLTCFLIAFACFVQTTRCFILANFLISMPNSEIPVNNVERAVIRGGNMWVLGLRSLYFATNLLLWIFGPIPMFVCSVVMVVLLLYLDRNETPLPEYGSVRSYDYYETKTVHTEMMKEVEESREKEEAKQIPNNGSS